MEQTPLAVCVSPVREAIGFAALLLTSAPPPFILFDKIPLDYSNYTSNHDRFRI
jgi:hypothetical protein